MKQLGLNKKAVDLIIRERYYDVNLILTFVFRNCNLFAIACSFLCFAQTSEDLLFLSPKKYEYSLGLREVTTFVKYKLDSLTLDNCIIMDSKQVIQRKQ